MSIEAGGVHVGSRRSGISRNSEVELVPPRPESRYFLLAGIAAEAVCFTSALVTMTPVLDSQLAFWVSIRHWGEQILICGLVAEVIMVSLYEWKFEDIPSVARLNHRRLLANVLAAVFVLVGVGVENIAGDRSDLSVNLIRRDDEMRLLRAQKDLAKAQKDLAKTETLIGGRLRLYQAAGLDDLSRFAGTRVFVQTTSVRIQQMLRQTENLPDWIAAEEFADSFKGLQLYAHWNYERLPDDQNTRVPHGVTLLTWKRMPFDTGGKVSEAAHALSCLLVNDLDIVPIHHEVTTLFEFPDLPRDGLLIQVGAIKPEEELRRKSLMTIGCNESSTK